MELDRQGLGEDSEIIKVQSSSKHKWYSDVKLLVEQNNLALGDGFL